MAFDERLLAMKRARSGVRHFTIHIWPDEAEVEVRVSGRPNLNSELPDPSVCFSSTRANSVAVCHRTLHRFENCPAPTSSESVDLPDHGWKCTAAVVWMLLIRAAARRTSRQSRSHPGRPATAPTLAASSRPI